LVANEGEPACTQKRQVFFLLGRQGKATKKKKSLGGDMKGKKKFAYHMKLQCTKV
jgi:hypothetical protein